MPDLRLPLSGDVNQNINPWSWYIPFTGNQFGLVNISLGNAGNPDAEKMILNDGAVGSYGKQLGLVGEVLRILVDKIDKTDEERKFSPEEMKTIEKFKTQQRRIDRLRKPTASRLEEMLAGQWRLPPAGLAT